MGKNDVSMYENLLYVSHMGLLMIIPIFGSVFLGRWLDQYFHTKGLLLLVTILFGVMSGFYNVYKFVMAKIGKNRGH